MKFAEMSQEVQVTRIVATPKRPDVAFTPGRRRANQVGFKPYFTGNQDYISYSVYRFSERQPNASKMPESLKESLSLLIWALSTGIVLPSKSLCKINVSFTSLGLPIPSEPLLDPNNEELIRSVMIVLEGRVAKRRCLQQQFKLQSMSSQDRFYCVQKNNFSIFAVDQVRSSVVTLERDNIGLKQENSSLKATMEQERVGRNTLEQKLVEAEGQLVSARLNLEGERDENRRLKYQVIKIRSVFNVAY